MVDADVIVIVNIIVITIVTIVNVTHVIAIKKVFLECFRKGI